MGGKGGSSTTKVELPPELQQGAAEVLAAGLRSASLPYSPNRGVTVAAFTPQQKQAMRGATRGARAFGLARDGKVDFGLPQAQRNDMGIKGYSTAPLYDEMINQSITPERQAEQQGIMQGFRNAAGRTYEAADIDPTDTGTPLPTGSGAGLSSSKG